MGLVTLLHQQAFLILGILVATYVGRKIATSLKLRAFDGPAFSSFSDWPHSLAILSSQCHIWYEEANKKYGKLHRCVKKARLSHMF